MLIWLPSLCLDISKSYSVDTPRELRRQVWKRIGTDLKPRHLERIAGKTICLDDLPAAFQAYIDGSVIGRIVVRI